MGLSFLMGKLYRYLTDEPPESSYRVINHGYFLTLSSYLSIITIDC